MSLCVSFQRDFLDRHRMTGDLSDQLIVDTILHRFRSADTENLMERFFLVHTVQHTFRKIFRKSGLSQIPASAHQTQRTVRTDMLQKIFLAAVLRITADEKSGAVNMSRPKQCPVQTAVLRRKKYLFHLPFQARVRRIMDISLSIFILRNLLVVRIVNRIPSHLTVIERLRKCFFLVSVDRDGMYSLRKGTFSPGNRPDFISLLQRHPCQCPAETAASSQDQNLQFFLTSYSSNDILAAPSLTEIFSSFSPWPPSRDSQLF